MTIRTISLLAACVQLLAFAGCGLPPNVGATAPAVDRGRIEALCQVLGSYDGRADGKRYDAAIDLGVMGRQSALPPSAIEALQKAANDDTMSRVNLDPVDGVVEITGLDMQLRIGDGAKIALCMIALGRTSGEAEQLGLLWKAYVDPQGWQFMRTFCVNRFLDFQSESVVPYLVVIATDGREENLLDRRWAALRLTEFLPQAADYSLALTRWGDWAVAKTALLGIERLGKPREWSDLEAPGLKVDAVTSSPGPLSPVRTVRVTYVERDEKGKPCDGLPICESVCGALEKLGLTVLGPEEGGAPDAILQIEVTRSPVMQSVEGADFRKAWGARIEGKIAIQAGGRSTVRVFKGETLREMRSWERPLVVPYGDALVRSDFPLALADAIAAGFGENYLKVAAALAEAGDWRLRLRMCWAISEVRDPKAVPWLTGILSESRDWLLQTAAAMAIGEIALQNPEACKFPETVNALLRNMNTAFNWHSRCTSVKALGLIRDKAAVKGLIEYPIRDECWLVRKETVGALGRIGDPRAVEALRKVAANDGDTRVRAEAQAALSEIQKK